MRFEAGTVEFENKYVEEGVYDAELKEVREVSEGKYGERVALVFDVKTSKETVELAHVCYVPPKVNENNKLGVALKALGARLDQDNEIETDALLGVGCRVMVEDFDKEGTKSSIITKVKPTLEVKEEKA